MIRALPALFPHAFFRREGSALPADPARHRARQNRSLVSLSDMGKIAPEAPRWDAPGHWIESESQW
ncbi:hypothetical protein [Mameliella sp. MMSF_3455]|uniref:hypothetical protein n=1 Tax=Mameliella sp. MMSF_3455 TaxID=3046714 RepID=UPI00273F8F1E|nr:hypothetical protein [Mameliella sp. MMSF_3455]